MAECMTEFELRERYGYETPEEKSLSEKVKDTVRCDQRTVKNLVFSFFPILTWLPNYSLKKHLPGDIIGGVTTAIVRIPQSLAYGLLAGVAPINGMYTAFFSPLAYTFLGTSSHISIGTFAVISLMIGSAQEKFISANPFVPSSGGANLQFSTQATTAGTATSLAVTTTAVADGEDWTSEEAIYKLGIVFSLTLLVGMIQIIMGFFNLGFVALFLSDPLVSGFTTGAAVYVFTAQVKYFFGIPLARQQAPFSLIKTYHELFVRLGETNWAEVVISVLTIVLLYPIKLINIKYKKQLRSIPIPMELIIVVGATIVSAFIDLREMYGVEIVGAVPKGLPTPIFPRISYWPSLVSDAISISIVSFAITVSIGKLFAKKHGYKISPNQELFALGVSQVASALFQGHAGAGSLSRSSVKESSGTKTQFSDVVSCVVILLVLLFIGPFLRPLPVACLSSIIMVNVRTLFNQFLQLPKLWRLCKYDFAVWIITFVGTILFGVDMGLMIGVAALLTTVVIRKYNTTGTISGKLGYSSVYGDVQKYVKAEMIEGVKIIRFGESPFFGNKESLENVAQETLKLKRKCCSRRDSMLKRRNSDQSEISQAMLSKPCDNDNDSGIASKLSDEKHKKRDDQFVVIVDSQKGDGKYNSRLSLSKSCSSRAMSTCSSSSSSCFSAVEEYFHTVVFDCSAWTFIDTMGMDIVKQICMDFKKVDLRVYLAGLQPKVFDKLSETEVFSEECAAVPYPTLEFAVEAAKSHPPCVE